jgi:hypothetical protein
MNIRFVTLSYFLLILIFTLTTDAAVVHARNLLPVVKIKADQSEWERFRHSQPAEARPLSVELMGMHGYMVYHGNPRNLRRKFASRRRQSLRISFPESGKKTIVYRTKAEDRTFLREIIAYRMFAEAGITAPHARLVVLEINGEPIGIYVEIIPVDALFVKNAYGDEARAALLYYGDPKRRKKKRVKSDFVPFNEVSEYPLAYTPVVTESDPKYHELDVLLHILNAVPFDIEKAKSVINLNQWARWFSISEILESADSPWYKGARNYSLLKPPSGKWQILPWDLDQVYRGKGIYLPETRVRGLRGLLSSPEFRRLKNSYIRKFLKEDFSSKKVFAWIDEMSPAIENAISRGMEKSVDLDRWEREVRELKNNILTRHSTLLELAEKYARDTAPSHK